jgi:5-methyltetrahydropteroyltriglutamate--homocysteine methyltransferase
MIRTSTLGFPSIGRQRELKVATEAFWSGRLRESEYRKQTEAIERAHFEIQNKAGIDVIASNDFSLYDRMLDMSVMLGQIPLRFGWNEGPVPLSTYFAMARGQGGAQASEMTKWFDTNYHYLVPEITGRFILTAHKPLAAYRWAKKETGLVTKPVLIGLYTYLRLAKPESEKQLLEWMEQLAPVYGQLLNELADEGIALLQIDEPALVYGTDQAAVRRAGQLYMQMAKTKKKTAWVLQTYFGHLEENWAELIQWPFDYIGLDVALEPKNRALIEKSWPSGKKLALGIVNGRNIWRTPLAERATYLASLREQGRLEDALLQPSTSLQHLPYSTALETTLDPEIRSWLAFSEQRLEELSWLKGRLQTPEDKSVKNAFEESSRVAASIAQSPKIHRESTALREKAIQENDFARKVPFVERYPKQMKRWELPPFPTTTIGSFPQTPEVRQARRSFIGGTMDLRNYQRFIDDQIREAIRLQKEIGLDVYVHGEFERTDMVEFFGQRLQGFAAMQHGWVQSYGTRYVRPPILFGDIARPEPMTTRDVFFAQALTKKPVKGMLTGPITILQWSFVREDISRERVAHQLAVALRDECKDLEDGGIGIIQVDEPALREGLPLKKKDQDTYLRWAVRAFKLATSGVKAETQIHTHMCYGDFNDIMVSILAMDADVISLENARSHEELLKSFREHKYDHGVGPGVYDIHSPVVPATEDMIKRIQAASRYIDESLLWVNPDCGLKTRGWPETIQSLKNMVEAAAQLRQKTASTAAWI